MMTREIGIRAITNQIFCNYEKRYTCKKRGKKRKWEKKRKKKKEKYGNIVTM